MGYGAQQLSYALCVLIVLSQPRQEAPSAQSTTVSAVVSAATEYVEKYEAEFAYLLGSEVYRQQEDVAIPSMSGRPSLGTLGNKATTRRVLRSEFFLTFVQSSAEWIAVRDTVDVDGRPVPNRRSVQAMLAGSSASAVARELRDRNAQFNLGRVQRNFNEPMFGLRVLERRHVDRFQFSLNSVDKGRSGTLATLRFEEKREPTLIVSPLDHHPIYASGQLTVEVITGTVRRTVVRFRDTGVSGEIETVYSLHPALGQWLPSELNEKWSGDSVTVIGTARYSDWHRFEVKSRIR